jgi:tetratricopeptide (TPR) repeat protein
MRAVELAPDSPYVLTTAGKIAIQNRDWAGAEQRLLRALELAGGADYEANMVYGSFLTDVGRPHEAIRFFRRAREAEPLLLRPSLMLESAYLLAGDFPAAAAEAEAGRSLLGDRILQQGAKMTRALAARDRPKLEQLLAEEGTEFNAQILRHLDDAAGALALLRARTASTSSTLHLDDVAGLDHLARVLHEAVGQRRDVDQAVLVHADVDEGAEGGDVADHALEDHAGLAGRRSSRRRRRRWRS